MQVSVETLEGLERKLIVTVPAKDIEVKIESRLKELAGKAKVDGFRQGHAPLSLVRSRYGKQVRDEVTQDMLQPTYQEALTKEKLSPAGFPKIELVESGKGKDFTYSATFEVFPEFDITELDKVKVEQFEASVSDKDVDKLIEKMRDSSKVWKPEEGAVTVKQGHKITLDFAGEVDGEPLEGGKAEGHEMIIGEGKMIPGFEDQLIGAKIDTPFAFDVTFPDDYHHEPLASKKATFNVTVKSIHSGELPTLDDKFAESQGVKKGGIDALKNDLRKQMERELRKNLDNMNRNEVFDALLEKNPIDVPKALVDEEIKRLTHEMYHQIFGPEHHDDEKIPEMPRELFEDRAVKRVRLGLLLSEYIQKHKVAASKERVNERLEALAEAYEDPKALLDYYRSDKKHMADIEALVTEEMVAEKIAESATIVNKDMSYEDVMNPKQDDEAKGE